MPENRGSQRNLNVFDRVREQVASLGRRVDMRAAKEKADANALGRGRVAASNTRQELSMARPDNDLPEDIRDHMRLMCDILTRAFRTDNDVHLGPRSRPAVPSHTAGQR